MFTSFFELILGRACVASSALLRALLDRSAPSLLQACAERDLQRADD
jgi:hypothetical protein